MNDLTEVKNIVEGLLFISGKGLSISEIKKGLDVPTEQVKTVLESLIDDYLERDGGIQIKESGGKYRFITHPKIFKVIQGYLKVRNKDSLSKSMLEVLAIITYKQPITVTEIDEIRGVGSRTMVSGLLNKKLIKSLGQKETIGKPSLYGTTKEFLSYFGLSHLEELPPPREIKEMDPNDF